MLDSEELIVLYVVRHGKTLLNSQGRFRGNKDVPLNESGLADAHKLATYLEHMDIGFIVSSDKIRATQTAKIIAAKHDDLVHKSENLRSFNVGDFSGQPRDAANMQKFQQYIDNPEMEIPGGESLAQFKDRVRPCIREAIEVSDEAGKPGLLVAHSSIVHEIGDMLYGDHKQVLVEPGGVIAVYVKNGKLEAAPIFKPILRPLDPNKADTIS